MKLIKYVFIIIGIFIFTSCKSDNKEILEKDEINYEINEDSNYSNIPAIIIGIEFSNEKLELKEQWSNKIFDKKSGTVNDYFLQATNGNLSLIAIEDDNSGNILNGFIKYSFDVEHPNPQDDYKDFYNDFLYPTFINSLNYFNWKQYDKNGNNKIEKNELAVIYIIAGQEQSVGELYNSVWAHSSQLLTTDNYLIDIDNYEFNIDYSLFGERHGDYIATIGVICHEMSHAILNLPDLYNTKDNTMGDGPLSLMALGAWNTIELPGDSPKEYSAYFKWKFNWVNKKEITNGKEIEIINSTEINETIVKIPITNDEYFLIENLPIDGYDKGLSYYIKDYKGGLAIWHIDEKIINEKFEKNEINNDVDMKGIDFIEANSTNLDNNKNPLYNDLFFKDNKDLLNDYSEPDNLKLNNNENSNIEISNISKINDIMYIDIHN
jgi:M6 family metalloprotease-like protein